MKTGYTHIFAIVDRSGSMQAIRTDTEGGLNSYVKDQAALPGECRFTITQFDTEFEVVHDDLPAAQVPPFRLVPRGATALYDAIGRTCAMLGEKFAAMPEDERPEKVIGLILTDGAENSSQEFTAATVKEVIDRQTKNYGWTFTYLGANQDAILTAGTIGIAAGQAINYAHTGKGTADVFLAASAATTRSRGGSGFSYSTAERRAAADGGTAGYSAIPDFGGSSYSPGGSSDGGASPSYGDSGSAGSGDGGGGGGSW